MPVLSTLRHHQASALLRRTPARTRQLPLSPAHQNPTTRLRSRRFQSTNPPPPPPPQTHRLTRLLKTASRFLPRRLQTSLQNLRSAPLSHISAFLVLHEVTAILPIFGLTYAFHALDWVPTAWVLGPLAAWAEEGLKKYVPYFRRKGWFGLEGGDGGKGDGEEVLEGELREEAEGWRTRGQRAGNADSAEGGDSASGDETKRAAVWRKVREVATVDNTEKGYRIGVQIAAAYAITKLLLVPRIALSLWLTPWLAGRFVRIRQAVRSKRS
ncbi:hypothetical protein GGS24DRAFT_218497 [Hypoxylon argillaceum]|nr:hypothetical protein GGS24DRAFT_218497 [Hypoxylon argillaceum]